MKREHSEDRLKIEDLDDATFWLNVHHRWGVQDAQRLYMIEDRLRWLERPWWRRIFRRRP